VTTRARSSCSTTLPPLAARRRPHHRESDVAHRRRSRQTAEAMTAQEDPPAKEMKEMKEMNATELNGTLRGASSGDIAPHWDSLNALAQRGLAAGSSHQARRQVCNGRGSATQSRDKSAYGRIDFPSMCPSDRRHPATVSGISRHRSWGRLALSAPNNAGSRVGVA